MKKVFKVFWKIYNLLVNIFGHICVTALVIAICYYLHTKDMLYFVLIGVIGILLLIILAICIKLNLEKKRHSKQ